MNDPSRIAILGLSLESNAFAPVSGLQDFHDFFYATGEELLGFATRLGFGQAMDELQRWEPVPIVLAAAESGGPLDHRDYLSLESEILGRLRAAGRIDGVFIYGHGAGLTTRSNDLDGLYFAAVRQTVGKDVPIVAELDLHGNVSEAMLTSADALVSYRTNPHLDQAERARECAVLLHALLNGNPIAIAHARLPLVTAQVTQLTRPGSPYGDWIKYGQSRVNSPVLNVSILSGFAFGDTPYNGATVLVHTLGNKELAAKCCLDVAVAGWKDRSRYAPAVISIREAVRKGADNVGETQIFADVADNPGGGGRGNTVHLLRAFHEARLPGVVAGIYFDPALVKQARAAGIGSRFLARINSSEQSPLSGRWEFEAEVVTLTDGEFTNTRGMYSGEAVHLGPSCRLRVGETNVLVCSLRNQVLSPDYFQHFGIDCRKSRALIVKSRGHFRAGFSELVDDDRIFEVDGPGLTTADLGSIEWNNLPRPVYPMDPGTEWTPEITTH